MGGRRSIGALRCLSTGSRCATTTTTMRTRSSGRLGKWARLHQNHHDSEMLHTPTAIYRINATSPCVTKVRQYRPTPEQEVLHTHTSRPEQVVFDVRDESQFNAGTNILKTARGCAAERVNCSKLITSPVTRSAVLRNVHFPCVRYHVQSR